MFTLLSCKSISQLRALLLSWLQWARCTWIQFRFACYSEMSKANKHNSVNQRECCRAKWKIYVIICKPMQLATSFIKAAERAFDASVREFWCCHIISYPLQRATSILVGCNVKEKNEHSGESSVKDDAETELQERRWIVCYVVYYTWLEKIFSVHESRVYCFNHVFSQLFVGAALLALHPVMKIFSVLSGSHRFPFFSRNVDLLLNNEANFHPYILLSHRIE